MKLPSRANHPLLPGAGSKAPVAGKVVLITVLGGIGTLWGGPVGAAVVVLLEDRLASSGFNGIGIITGTIFVVIVLAFRHGILGTARNGINSWLHRRRLKSGQSL